MRRVKKECKQQNQRPQNKHEELINCIPNNDIEQQWKIARERAMKDSSQPREQANLKESKQQSEQESKGANENENERECVWESKQWKKATNKAHKKESKRYIKTRGERAKQEREQESKTYYA